MQGVVLIDDEGKGTITFRRARMLGGFLEQINMENRDAENEI